MNTEIKYVSADNLEKAMSLAKVACDTCLEQNRHIISCVPMVIKSTYYFVITSGFNIDLTPFVNKKFRTPDRLDPDQSVTHRKCINAVIQGNPCLQCGSQDQGDDYCSKCPEFASKPKPKSIIPDYRDQ